MNYTVLTVSDTLSTRVQIREILSGLNTKCVQGANGREALELSAEIDPDLLIIDRELPFISGIEASRVIHMSQPDLPIIMLAEDISDELREHAAYAGVNRILFKPLEKEELVFFVSRLLGAIHENV